jgi:hypothetical protein
VGPLALLVGVAIWALAVQRAEMAAAPQEQEWTAAPAIVRENYQPGDVIRTSPWWADQGRAGLFDYTFDLSVEASDWELYRYNHLWIISDAEHADSAIETLPEGYAVGQQWRPTERTAVFRVDIPSPEHILFDARRDIEAGHVFWDYPDHSQACTLFAQGGWHCDRIDTYLNVTPMLQEVGGSLRTCLYTAMVPDAELRITWDAVPMGSRLEGQYGNTMPGIRADRGSDIDFRVHLGDEVRFSHRFGKWDQQLFEFSIDTQALAGSTQPVSLVFHADDFYDRWICFRARSVR